MASLKAANAAKTPTKKSAAVGATPQLAVAPVSGATRLSPSSCACGGSCPRCKRRPSGQPTLRVSQPNDPYEQQADEAAERVMRTPDADVEQRRRWNASNENPASTRHMSGLQRSHGVPLSRDARAFFEPRFRQGFDSVRIHHDEQANEMTRAVNARAFTVGGDVYFSQGEFDAHSTGGRRLLAHELAHVVQQRKNPDTRGTIQREVTDTESATEETEEPADVAIAPLEPAADEAGWSWERLRAEHLDVARDIYTLSRETPQYLEDLEAGLSERQVGIQASPAQRRRILDYWDYQTDMRRRGLYDAATLYEWALKLDYAVNLTGSLLNLYERRLGTDPGHAFAIELYRRERNRILNRVQRFREREYVRQGLAMLEERDAEDVDPQAAAMSELRELIRSYHDRWGSNLRDNATLLIGPIVQIMDRHIGRESSDLVAFFRRVRSDSPEMLNFLVRDVNLIDNAYREFSSPFRVVAIAILGNWTEALEEDPDSVVAPGTGDEFDEFSESHATAAALAEDLIGTATDMGIGLIPGLDQVTDARDLSADIFLIERDIERREFSIMHLVSLVFSLIGTFPELGTLISRSFRAITRTIRRVGYRGIARLVNMIERVVPGLFDHIDEMSRVIGEMWTALMAHAVQRWDNAMAGLTRIGETLFEAGLERVQRIRRYVAEHLPAGFARARELLSEFVATVRNRAGRAVEAISESTSEALAAARHRIQGLTATGRLRREFADRLEALEIDATAAALAGNDRLASELLARLSRLADDAEHAGGRVVDDVASDRPVEAAEETVEAVTSTAERRAETIHDTPEPDAPSSTARSTETPTPRTGPIELDTAGGPRTVGLRGRRFTMCRNPCAGLVEKLAAMADALPEGHAGRAALQRLATEVERSQRRFESGIITEDVARALLADHMDVLGEIQAALPDVDRLAALDLDALVSQRDALRSAIAATSGVGPVADVDEAALWGGLRAEVGLDPAGPPPTGRVSERIEGAVEDATSAGLIDTSGNPLGVDLAVQPHGNAPETRAALGLTGADRQSAHIAATSLVREVAGYSRRLAETVLLDRPTHRAFDQHWMQWVANERSAIRAAGGTDFTTTLSEIIEAQRRAIQQTPNLSQRQRDTMEWLLELEIQRLAAELPDGLATRVPLPDIR